MAKPPQSFAALLLMPVLFSSANARAETVRLACVAAPGADICPSHWIINSDAKTVTWRWCASKDTTQQRNVIVTPDVITFDEEFMARHYEFDRKSGRMTLTASGDDGVRFDDGESICKAVSD